MSESRAARFLEKGLSHRIISLRFGPRLRNACRSTCGLGITSKAEAKSESAGRLSRRHVEKESYLIRGSQHSSTESWWCNCKHMVIGLQLGEEEMVLESAEENGRWAAALMRALWLFDLNALLSSWCPHSPPKPPFVMTFSSVSKSKRGFLSMRIHKATKL